MVSSPIVSVLLLQASKPFSINSLQMTFEDIAKETVEFPTSSMSLSPKILNASPWCIA